MNEIKVYGVLLVLMLGAAYASHSRGDGADTPASDKVAIVDAQKEAVKSITLFAKTQTVSVGLKKDDKGEDYFWFTVEQNKRTRSFVGNDKAPKMLETFAPFMALRSLGKLTGKELEETKLDKPERRLVLSLKGGDREIELGGRTSGARDHYVRVKGGAEVYLVASAVLGDLEFPEGRFMQRKLREAPLKEVSKLVLSTEKKSGAPVSCAADDACGAGEACVGGACRPSRTFLHNNRLSPADAFWSVASKPEEKSETAGNYVDKLDKLTAVEYPSDADKPSGDRVHVLTATWYGEDDAKPLGSTELWRYGEDKKAEYFGISTTTRLLVKVSKLSAEQLERDLPTVLGD